jgi:glutamine amidotransferase
MELCILDYGSGNVKSVFNAFSQFSNCTIANDVESLRRASHLVLPGVGSFKGSMEKINNKFDLQALSENILGGKPFLGICVGMQVLGKLGIEFEEVEGLGYLDGVVSRLDSNGLPLPHVGWNNLHNVSDNQLTRGITDEDDFYFVHSYGYTSIEESNVLANTIYGNAFPAIVGKDNMFGVQFHPEKSQKSGKKIIENFLGIR